MPERFFLHVGSPKTGTTFLQDVLWTQRQKAQDQGLLLPLTSFHDHFLASVDLRGLSADERFPARTAGIWNRLVEESLAWPGDVLVSHELFSGTTADQARKAVEALAGVEFHVILTARDLVRQIPAEWQEHVKHRSAIPFGDFVAGVFEGADSARWFWTVQDYADICRRWATVVAPHRIHLVTVPAPGGKPDVLWDRFAGVVGLEAGAFDLAAGRANTSLRAEQAELVRRINGQLGDRLGLPGTYPAAVKDLLAQSLLVDRPGTPLVLLPDDRARAVQKGRKISTELSQLGVHVVGDLADLVPDHLTGSGIEVAADPTGSFDRAVLVEAMEALIELLDRFVKQSSALQVESRQNRRLARENGELALIVQDMRARPLRFYLLGVTERRKGAMRLRVAYWRTVNAGRWVRRLGRKAPSSADTVQPSPPPEPDARAEAEAENS